MINIQDFESKIKYEFKNKDLVTLALTHSSFSNEKKRARHENNERLEFLGDAVLDLVISQYIYTEFSEMPEGELSKLRAGIVCEPTIARKAESLGLGDFLLLGKGEESTGGRTRESILADAFEAVIGAIFLDGEFETAKKFVINTMIGDIDIIKQNYKVIDCKTHLQEHIQKMSKQPVVYNIVDEIGPDHDKVFVAEVYHNNEVLGRGEGKSKKEAEQNAAAAALRNVNES